MLKSARMITLSGKENPSCFSQKKKQLTSEHNLQSSEVWGCGCVGFFIIIGYMVIPAQSQEVVKLHLYVSYYISLGINNFPILCPLKNFFMALKSTNLVSAFSMLLPAAKPLIATFICSVNHISLF